MKNKLLILLFVICYLLFAVSFVSAEKTWNFNNHTVNISDDLYVGGTIYGGAFDGVESYWNVSGSYLFPYDLSKNVGIGTISPNRQLDVNDDLRVGYNNGDNSYIELTTTATDSVIGFLNNADTVNWEVRDDGGVFEINEGSNINNRFAISSVGKVGVRISNPSQELQVRGLDDTSAHIRIDSVGNVDAGYMVAANISEYVWTFGVDYSDGTGNLEFNSGFFLDSSPDFVVGAGGNISAVTDFCITGGNCLSSASSGGDSLWNESGNYIYPYNLSKNIGIGTDSPESEFHLVSDTNNDFKIDSDRISLQFNSAGHVPYIEWRNSSGTRLMYQGWGDGSSYVQTTLENGADYAITGGNVGIGDTTPDAQFTVYGTSSIGGSNLANARALFGTTSAGIGIDNNEIAANGSDLYIRTLDTNDIVFGANVGEDMRIDSNGRVSIGAGDGPGAILTVGTATGAAGGIEVRGAPYGLSDIAASLQDLVGTGEEGVLRLYYNGASKVLIGANRDSYINGGDLGIGNNAPGALLDVGKTTDTASRAIRVTSADAYNAGFEAYGAAQGTGYLYVGQSGTYGGGISYNGDGTPVFATGESADKITFFRRTAGTTSEVFGYSHNSDTVDFNGDIIVSGGDISTSTAYIDLSEENTGGFTFSDTTGTYPDFYCKGSGGSGYCEFKSGIYNNGGTLVNGGPLIQRGSVYDDGGNLVLHDNVTIDYDLIVSGDVGIGDTTPDAKLDVEGTIYATGYGRDAHAQGHLVGSYASVGANSAKSNPIYTIGSGHNPTDADLGNMYGIGYSNDAYWHDIEGMGRDGDGWGFYVAADGDIRATISGSSGAAWFAGEVQQGATDYGDYELQATGQAYISDYIVAMGGVHVGGTSDPGTDNLAVDNYAYVLGGIHVGGTSDPGTDNLIVDANVTALAYYYSSDERLKMDVEKIESSLENIKKLEGISFNWKDGSGKSLGLIAQDVEKIYPELVGSYEILNETTNETEIYKTVQYGNLVAPLIEAVKELDAKNTEQDKKIEEQEKRIEELEKKLNLLI